MELIVILICCLDIYNIREEDDQEAVDKNKLADRIGTADAHSELEPVAENETDDHKSHKHPQKQSSSSTMNFPNNHFWIISIAIVLTYILKL